MMSENRPATPTGDTLEIIPVGSTKLGSWGTRVLSCDDPYGGLTARRIQESGFGLARFDRIIFAHSLEHIYDPWSTLVNVRPLLRVGGKLLVWMTNLRNINTLAMLLRGEFGYRGTQPMAIRYFTTREMVRMLAETGYRVLSLVPVRDPRFAHIQIPPGETHIEIDVPQFRLRAVSKGDLPEFTASKMMFLAEPI